MKPTAPTQPPLPLETLSPLMGKDELNLAEFPLTKLGKRDKRDILTYEDWVPGKHRKPQHIAWTVRGAAGLGLPHEAGDQVVLALLYLCFQQKPPTRKVEFSLYELLKITGVDPQGKHTFDRLTLILRQLAGVTIESHQAFHDRDAKRRVSLKSFHLIEELWLRKFEGDREVLANENNQGYIIWSQEIWKSLRSGYIKNLDLRFYFALPSPLSRRLYRFADRRLRHQAQFEIDVFQLAGRLGMARYSKPSETYRKLKPGIDQLVEAGYLASGERVKQQKYTRVRLVRATEQKKHHQAKVNAELVQVEQIRRARGKGEEAAKLDRLLKQQLKSNLTGANFSLLGQVYVLSVEDDGSRRTGPPMAATTSSTITVGSANRFALQRVETELAEEMRTTLSELLNQESIQLHFERLNFTAE